MLWKEDAVRPRVAAVVAGTACAAGLFAVPHALGGSRVELLQCLDHIPTVVGTAVRTSSPEPSATAHRRDGRRRRHSRQLGPRRDLRRRRGRPDHGRRRSVRERCHLGRRGRRPHRRRRISVRARVRVRAGPGERRPEGGDDVIISLDGDDCLYGGNGNDSLDGGPGLDLLSYRYSASPVRVNLARGTPTGEGTDSVAAVEDVVGSSFGDVLTGDGGTNVFRGEGGADRLVGGAGTDRLDGGSGRDRADGGVGRDHCLNAEQRLRCP